MRAIAFAAVLLLAGLPGARAQPALQDPASLCERLAGPERERCLAQEKERRGRLGRDEGDTPRNCDRLFGPEKELCLKRGGTVRADAPTGAVGGTAAPSPARGR